jgi:hypothetical protein
VIWAIITCTDWNPDDPDSDVAFDTGDRISAGSAGEAKAAWKAQHPQAYVIEYGSVWAEPLDGFNVRASKTPEED